jgi:thioredoxin reductase (NADPH)
VVVIGGGEAALDTALSASDRGAIVEVLARGTRLQAIPALISEVDRAGIHVRLCAEVVRVEVRDGRSLLVDGDGAERSVDHLVVCIGREPEDELLRELGPLAPTGAQKVPGLFAAGDLIRGRDRYIATALGDGQQAALQAAHYIRAAGGDT